MPNANVLNQKKAKVAEIVELLKGSTAGVLVDYSGITVEDDTKLRKELREAGVRYFVEKNTLLKLAMNETGYEGLTGVLNGTTAIAVSDDETAAARILGKYAEDHENFKLKAGYIGSEVFDAAGVMALSKIPSKNDLPAQLVASLHRPIHTLAATLAAVADSKEGEAA